MTQVYINADETLQVRRAKAILKRAAFIARSDGSDVEARHNRIRIENTIFTVDNVHTLPQKYTTKTTDAEGGQPTPMVDTNDQVTDHERQDPPNRQKFVI